MDTTSDLQYITQELYYANMEAHGTDHELWKSAYGRWHYHRMAVALAQMVPIDSPSQVLEAGSIGAQIVQGSDTLDTASMWRCIYTPTYTHDMRHIPWPIDSGRYELFIALRVWQHLIPCQQQAFLEACRIAKYVLIGIPELSYPYVEHSALNEHMLKWGSNLKLVANVQTIPNGGTDCNLYLWCNEEICK